MNEPGPNRRAFVRALALGASTGAVLAPSPLRAHEPEPQQPEDADEPPPEPSRSEVDLRMDLILARFGEHLDDEETRAQVRARVEAVVRRAEALRQIALDNGEGPFPVFQPYRAPLI